MAVKRERPQQGIPGELHTPDGRVLRLKLPGEPEPDPAPEREPDPASEASEHPPPDDDDPA